MKISEDREVSDGMTAHGASLISAVLGYLKARLALAGLEAKDAGAIYVIAAAMGLGALFIAALGYVFFIITVGFAVALAFGDGTAWLAVMGGVAILHLGGGAAWQSCT